MKNIDFSVYVITASVPALHRNHEAVAAAAVCGGATILQFRDKCANDTEFAKTAEQVRNIARLHGVPFIVNDRVEIAVSVDADGVHIGHDDADVRRVRKLLPPAMIVGASATSYDEAIEMCQAGADYLGVGPVFATGSKEDASPAIGVNELARICRAVNRPVVAIGGINRNNLPLVIKAGAAGAAVIAAVAQAPDMEAAVVDLNWVWQTFDFERHQHAK
jgi:thiamine-phosphate diphosphorylase